MAFNKIPDYSTTAASNTDIGGVSIAEGFPAANINNSERQLLAQLKTECALRSTVASSGTVDISTSGAYDVTGTTTITAFTIGDGTKRQLTFTGTLTLTHNATSLICPGGANITTAAGDTCTVLGIGTNQCRITTYQRAAQSPTQTVNVSLSDGRLTLTSGTPVTSSNVTAATTLFFTPYKGNQHSIYTGTQWQVSTLAELSIAVPATTNTNYDVFLDYNSGSPQLALLAWTNQTTRATALTTQDGILVLTGTLTKKYLGTFCTTGVSGQTEDSQANRFVWNYYNRISRSLLRQEGTATWTYSTATFRQANASTANKVSIVSGVAEDVIDLTLNAAFQGTTTAATAVGAIGLDSTTTVATGSLVADIGTFNGGSTVFQCGTAKFCCPPQLGKHDFNWLEKGIGSGTQTWLGGTETGLTGLFMA